MYPEKQLSKRAAKSFLGTVLAENRMDHTFHTTFSDAHVQEDNLAPLCMQEVRMLYPGSTTRFSFSEG